MEATTVVFPPTDGTLTGALAQADAIGRQAGRIVARNDVCRVAIGELRLSDTDSLAVARAVFGAFFAHVDSVGQLTFQPVWKTAHVVVPTSAPRNRVMLPHHDGGSVTRLETPDTAESGSPKAYAGFVVIDPGAGTARTTFYDLLAVIRNQLAAQHPTLAAATRWYARTIALVGEVQRRNHIVTRYVTIPMMLGVRSPALVAIDRSEGHEDITAEEIDRLPELDTLRRSCACGGCVGEVSRIFCRGIFAATGLSWPLFRARYEVGTTARRWDLVLWNNVFRQHGAVGGGAGRTLMHVYAVAGQRDSRYSAWLATHWARHWERMEHRELTN